jgi:hypothetical protein
MDRLEKFIREHRSDFDSQMPSKKVWQGIQEQIKKTDQGKKGGKVVQFKVSFLWRAAAAVLFIVTASVLWVYNTNTEVASQQYALNEELNEIEQYYTTDFNNRIAQFASDESYLNVAPDLEQIDIVIQELKEELALVPEDRKEQVIHGIIQNYMIKIQILERVLDRQADENLSNEKNEVYEI